MFRTIYKYGELEVFRRYKESCLKAHPLIDLFWEVTLNCNMKCKHCGSFAAQGTYPDELTTEEIKAALRNVASKGNAERIFLNVTGGEPMTRADLYEVMTYAVKELGFHWGMTTNGTLLTDENIKKLRDAEMDTVSISIDGLEETHDSFRNFPGSYKTIIENVERLRDAGFVKHIQISTVFHKKNIKELESIYREVQKLKVHSLRLISMDPIGRAESNRDLLLSGDDIRTILDFIKEKNKTGNKKKDMRLDYGCPGFLGMKYEGEVRPGFFHCRTGISIASILYNGDLFVCPNVPRRPEFIQGNVRTDDFWDVWNNRYTEFRSQNRTSNDECRSCEQWEYCLGGAFHTWDFDKNTQKQCPYMMLKQ